MPSRKPIRLSSSSALVVFAICCLFFSSDVLAKSRRPISEAEVRQKRSECYADVDSGLWGWQCKSSMIAKENCALRCLSQPCYEIIYANDPLEEGEKDLVRSQEFKYCMHKLKLNGKAKAPHPIYLLAEQRLSLGESLEGIKGSFDY